jgi:hypothetical protein
MVAKTSTLQRYDRALVDGCQKKTKSQSQYKTSFMRRLGINDALKVILPFAERELKMASIAYNAAPPRRMRMSGEMIISSP